MLCVEHQENDPYPVTTACQDNQDEDLSLSDTVTKKSNDQLSTTIATAATATATTKAELTKELHIAPMLNYSTREFRQLLRILSRRVILWTEMVVDETIQHATNLDEHLLLSSSSDDDDDDYTGCQTVCQIGGNCPETCGQAARTVLNTYGYDEINLNVDCPSERVSQKGEFGAILMTKATLTAAIVQQMQQSATAAASAASAAAGKSDNDSDRSTTKSSTQKKKKEKQVSIKCRIGVDDWDDLEFVASFVATLRPFCKRFYLHARKCVLNGLVTMNARQNRTIPPLNYPRVYQLAERFPDCYFWINGGIMTLQQAKYIVYGSLSAAVSKNNDDITTKESDSSSTNQTTTDTTSCSYKHEVPCKLCNQCSNSTNGSCIAPPLLAPPNLRGCMMGRAAIDDPCLFYNVDTYFYGEPTNPCQNRRQVLERYCLCLEQMYPRRCCDNDNTRLTFEYPAPSIILEQDVYCPVCAPMYNGKISVPAGSIGGSRSSATAQTIKVKISSRIIGRCLRPVQGMFRSVPGGRLFRRVCDQLGQDLLVRNCGPGFILRTAIREAGISNEVLDRDFDDRS